MVIDALRKIYPNHGESKPNFRETDLAARPELPTDAVVERSTDKNWEKPIYNPRLKRIVKAYPPLELLVREPFTPQDVSDATWIAELLNNLHNYDARDNNNSKQGFAAEVMKAISHELSINEILGRTPQGRSLAREIPVRFFKEYYKTKGPNQLDRAREILARVTGWRGVENVLAHTEGTRYFISSNVELHTAQNRVSSIVADMTAALLADSNHDRHSRLLEQIGVDGLVMEIGNFLDCYLSFVGKNDGNEYAREWASPQESIPQQKQAPVEGITLEDARYLQNFVHVVMASIPNSSLSKLVELLQVEHELENGALTEPGDEVLKQKLINQKRDQRLAEVKSLINEMENNPDIWDKINNEIQVISCLARLSFENYLRTFRARRRARTRQLLRGVDNTLHSVNETAQTVKDKTTHTYDSLIATLQTAWEVAQDYLDRTWLRLPKDTPPARKEVLTLLYDFEVKNNRESLGVIFSHIEAILEKLSVYTDENNHYNDAVKATQKLQSFYEQILDELSRPNIDLKHPVESLKNWRHERNNHWKLKLAATIFEILWEDAAQKYESNDSSTRRNGSIWQTWNRNPDKTKLTFLLDEVTKELEAIKDICKHLKVFDDRDKL